MTDLDNAASESTDISNTDIENFKNDAVDEMEKLNKYKVYKRN
ncbi:hypothetical protein [Staphylococcus saprophyticus]|nr:hypothetical protein [Staphylococcus saprophyticus]